MTRAMLTPEQMRQAEAATPEKLARLAKYQQLLREFGVLPAEEQSELDALRRELAMAPEVADDPATLFTDESRRPQLNGTDYLEEQYRRDCEELGGAVQRFIAKHGVELLWQALEIIQKR